MRAGGALLVRDEDLTAAWVTRHVLPLTAEAGRLAAMSAAAATLGRRDADVALARMVLDVGRAGPGGHGGRSGGRAPDRTTDGRSGPA